MLIRTFPILTLGMIALGCSSDGTKSTGTPPTTCSTDYAQIAAGAPTISFKNDVLPIFGLSCASATECHNINDVRPKADLVLGVKGNYDATAKWKYTFPPTADFLPDGAYPDGGGDPVKSPHSLTQGVIDAVYANLMLPSKTISTVKRVAPSDPGNSFLIHKLADIQNKQSYSSQCQNQDPTKSQEGLCGDKMPQTGSGSLCATATDRFNAVVQWIAQGAPNN